MDPVIHVGFSTPTKFNPVSWLVRKFTSSTVSHAWFLYYSELHQTDMVVEAHELGFRTLSFEHFKKENVIVAVHTPKFPLILGFRRVTKAYLGTGYDWGGLIGMAVVKIGRMLKRRWKNPFRGKNHVFCSEAVYRSMKWSPGYEKLRQDPDSVDPEDLMRHLAQHRL